MKEHVTLAVIAIVVGSLSARAMPAFGVRAGVNFANIATRHETGGSEEKIRTGAAFGCDAEFALSADKTVSIRNELIYVAKGTVMRYSSEAYDFDTKQIWRVDEIVVAPFLVYRFPLRSITPFFELGPEAGLNIVHKVHTDLTHGDDTYSDTYDLDEWSSSNFSWNFGAGATSELGKGELVFDIRYNLGLLNMYTGKERYSRKTNGIQFVFGYNFTRIGK